MHKPTQPWPRRFGAASRRAQWILVRRCLKLALLLAAMVCIPLVVGCAGQTTTTAPGARSTPAAIADIREDMQQADAKLLDLEPEVKDRPKAATLAAGARQDLARGMGKADGAEKQATAEAKAAAKLADENRELKEDDPQKRRLRNTAYGLYCLGGLLLLASIWLSTIRLQLWVGAGVSLGFGGLFSALAYWVKTIAAVMLGLFAALVAAAVVLLVWYGWHLWTQHRAQLELRILGPGAKP